MDLRDISKKLSAIFLVCILFPAVLSAEKLKIGVLTPLSGGYAIYGQAVAAGIELANDGEFELVVEDIATMSGKGAVSAAQRLIDIEKIDLGIVFAIDDAEAVAPIFNKKKVPFVVAWDSNYRIEEMGEYSFSAGFDTFYGGELLAEYLASTGQSKKIGIIGEDCAYNRIAREGFLAKAKEYDFKIVMNEFTQMGERDLKSLLLKLKQSKADTFVFLPVLPETLLVGVKQMQQLNISLPFVTNELLVGEYLSGENVDLGDGCGIWIPEANSEQIMSKYTKKHGKAVWNHGPLVVGYRAMEHIMKAFAEGPGSTEEKMLAYFGSNRRLKNKHALWCIKNDQLAEQTLKQ